MCALAYFRKHTQTSILMQDSFSHQVFQIHMHALETATETKWDLYLYGKKWISCVGDVWQHFPNFGLTSAQVLVNEFS